MGQITDAPKRVLDKWGADNNVLYVGAGCEYTTIQTAVTAASAVATSSSPCYVAYEPGVELTFTPAPYVHVVPTHAVADYSDSANGNQDIVDCPWHPVQVPYDMPLVAIVCDDAVALDETPDAASGFFGVPQGAPFGAEVTPFAYAVSKGIPISHAVFPNVITTPANKAGNYTYMTPAQLRWCQLYNGAEILSHSYIHQTQPATVANMLKEIVGSRDALAALTAADYTAPTGYALVRSDGTDTTPDELGAAIRGFVMPGSWTDTKARLAFMRAALGRLIRSTYQYSCEPNLTIAGSTTIVNPAVRHGIARATFALSAGGGIEANAANINTLGTRTILMFHAYGTTNNWTGWKAAIDILAAARDAGLIALVTPSTLVNAITVPQNAGHRTLWGGVPNGDFADGDVMWTKGGAATIAEGVATLPIDGSVYMSLPLKGGHSYTLRFNAKVTGSGTTVLRIYTDYHWVKAAAGTTNALYCAHARTLTNASDPGATAYDTAYPQYHTFYVPKWAQRVQITLRCYSGTAGDTIVVDNVGLALA
jgi:hypothetical protein